MDRRTNHASGPTGTPVGPDGVMRSPEPMSWLGTFFGALWSLLVVIPSIAALAGRDPELSRTLAIVMLAFVVAYLVALVNLRGAFRPVPSRPGWTFWPAVVGMGILAVAAMAIDVTDGASTLPFVAVIGALWLRRRGLLAVAGVTLVSAMLSWWFTGSWWIPGGVEWGVLTAGCSIWGLWALLDRRNESIRRLAAESELALSRQQERFARDLHDILGHSLTVITVKAELAGKLIDAAPERAKVEVADLERLSREALADVRRAVSGYREISLPGEIARARAVLTASGVEAHLPTSADAVPDERREVLAWALREGVTNVVRHAGARTCTVALSSAGLSVTDDGSGKPGEDGNGIRGLRERAASAGATVVRSSRLGEGSTLTVRFDEGSRR